MPPPLLLFLLLSEGAAEGRLGPALTPGRALKCKEGRELGGGGLGRWGGASGQQQQCRVEEVMARLPVEG